MSDLTLTKTLMRNGAWEGIITCTGDATARPNITVMYLDQPVEKIELKEGPDTGQWTIRIPVPAHAIADGVQTFVVFDKTDNSKLAHFTLIAGDPLADDIRAEIELLRAELDMLKRAFRRHCLETM
ncbi:MAG: hypothetical protein JKY94_17210 [Rhodobacteraceae bacterium]|nr:hypothetical protein [Paracoccaceae bacterium]